MTEGQHFTRFPALRAAGVAMGQKGLPHSLETSTIKDRNHIGIIL